MSKVTLRLKLSMINALSISRLPGLDSNIYLDTDNPTIELEENQAKIVLGSENGHAIEVVSAGHALYLMTREQLRAEYKRVLSVDAPGKLSDAKIISAVEDALIEPPVVEIDPTSNLINSAPLPAAVIDAAVIDAAVIDAAVIDAAA